MRDGGMRDRGMEARQSLTSDVDVGPLLTPRPAGGAAKIVPRFPGGDVVGDGGIPS